MITAEHKKWADNLFRTYLKRLFRQHFNTIQLLEPLPVFEPERPLLLLPNHSTWWDGFLVYWLNREIWGRQLYLMMLENQLQRHQFFRKVGAYSIEPATFHGIRESIRYTTRLLQQENAPLVCVFPQGELQPWNIRPLKFRRGLELILKQVPAEVQVCLLGMRAVFLTEQRPDVFLQLRPLDSGQLFSAGDAATTLTQLLKQLDQRIATGETGQILFQGKMSINERLRADWKQQE